MSVGQGKIRVFRADDEEAKKSESSTRGKSVSSQLIKAPKPEPRVHRVDGNQTGKRVVANGRKGSSFNSNGPREPISAGQSKSPPSLDKRHEPLEAIRV